VDLGSGEKTPILKNPQGSVFQTRFSFDDHWIVFNAVGGTGSRVFVARFVSGRAIETADWIAVSDGLGWEDKPRWSPDGNLVYFVSTRDGSWCIYASRLDPSTKHPATDRLIDVQHFHSGRLSPRNVHVQEFEISVAADKLVLNLGEVTGNIWIAELKEE
jgi:Tol biopolymer transport system component